MDSIKKSAVQNLVKEIYEDRGEVRASVLVERAAPEDSPAHNAFEWDDTKAGHEFRLIQARVWIRRVEIIIENRPERFIHVPLVRVEGKNYSKYAENYYKPISVVRKNPDEYKLALNETLARLNTTKEVYNQLKIIAKKATDIKIPDFIKVDKGFKIIERALQT